MCTAALVTRECNNTKVILYEYQHPVNMAVFAVLGVTLSGGGFEMFLSVLVLAVSSALMLFYIQAICEKAMKRRFRRPYFRKMVEAFQLEYPLLLGDSEAKSSFTFAQSHLALKCDFITLKYLLKNGSPARRRLTGHEWLLLNYFRLLLLSLSIRHAFRLRDRKVLSKLTTILQFFANSVGERMSLTPLANAQVAHES